VFVKTNGWTSVSNAPLDLIAANLRRERDRTGMSLSELAKKAGIAKSTLSQLESGAGNPSVETLWALGVALGVPFSRLVEPAVPRVQVIRAGEGPVIYSERAHYSATLLAACRPGTKHDIYWIALEPGGARESEPHVPGSVEHMIVASGRCLAGLTDDPVELGPGDYIVYPGDLPHICKALEPGTTAMMVMEHTA
jgi:transcriptional regulator with XRE-family HTH domain